MKRAFAGAIASLVYWGVGLTVWGACFLADLLADCLDNAICRRDKPLWLLVDFAILAAMALVYAVAIVRYLGSAKRRTGASINLP